MKKVKKHGLQLAVTLVLCLLATSAFAFGKNKFEQEVEKEAGAIKLFREIDRGGYGVITTSELYELISGSQDVVIVDTMPYESSYQKSHIPGASQFLFPIPEMQEWDSTATDNKTMADFEKLLGPDKDKTIVVYCGFVKCTRSHNGAFWATKLGYTNVYRHPGGIFAWKGAGYATESVQ